MSRIIASVILVLIVIGSCVTGEVIVHNCNDKISSKIEVAAKLADSGDIAGAEKAARATESAFADCEGALAVFINHTLVEDLGEQIARLPTLATEETKAEFLSELASARIMLTHIVRDNRPTLLNIL